MHNDWLLFFGGHHLRANNMNISDYILQRKATGDARTTAEIEQEYQTVVAEIEATDKALFDSAPEVARRAKAVQNHNAVNAWLASLQSGTAAQKRRFDVIRTKMTFREQLVEFKANP